MAGLTLFATCPRGVEHLLASELTALGADRVRAARAGVGFSGDLRAAYAACLWSRVASRVILRVSEATAGDVDSLYTAALAVPWERHLSVDSTFAVDLTESRSGITHTKYAALKVKDAIADRFREREGRRPNVDVGAPDVRVNVSLRGARVTFGIDLAGESLHRRGYREPGAQAEAPLKENLAAAVLLLAGWPAIAAEGRALVDPLCGSGTLPIEAALIAGDVAPGIFRARWGFEGWLGHRAALWDEVRSEAESRRRTGASRVPPLFGFDRDSRALGLARDAAARAGLGAAVRFERAELAGLAAPPGVRPGLVVANAPYGERLGTRDEAEGVHRMLRERWREGFPTWRLALLTADVRLAGEAGLTGARVHELMNGPLPVVLAVGASPAEVAAPAAEGAGRRGTVAAGGMSETEAAQRAEAGAAEFANRLRKNARHLSKWARREHVTCYRVYDADLPDFALAVDLYQGAGPDEGRRWAHVAEYAAPASVDPVLAAARLGAAVPAVAEVLGAAEDDVHVKVRRRQRGTAQYERQGRAGVFHTVSEGGSLFLVNLADYLDTGLFLDHRPTRLLVRERAEGKRVLNLFGYTGAFSVHAAAGGATSTLTLDLSSTYLDWARRNLDLNGFGEPSHATLRADALRWMAEGEAGDRLWDLVVLDPPSFSNSAAMDGTLDVQRDQLALIGQAVRLLAEGGVVLFSTNMRQFRLDADGLEGLEVRDVTALTVPPDFARTPRAHGAWLLWRRGEDPGAWSDVAARGADPAAPASA